METNTLLKPRLAFIGVGWIGRDRMQAAATSGLADIVRIADVSENCLAEANKIVPGCRTDLQFQDTIMDPDVDAVVIATPSALHMQQTLDAFAQGKAVFCQKPLCRTAKEVRTVLQAAASANKLLGVDFSYRYTAAFQSLYDTIQSGTLGKIFAVDLKFHNAYGPDKSWFYDINQSGGGCVLDLGIHLIDLVLYALSFPEVQTVESNLYAKGNAVKNQSQVEDYADVLMTLEDGVTVKLSCSWNLNAGCDAIIEASFYGTNGGVSMKNVNGSFYDFEAIHYKGTQAQQLTTSPDDWGGRALVDWIGKLSDDDQYKSEAEQYLRSAEVVDRIYGRM